MMRILYQKYIAYTRYAKTFLKLNLRVSYMFTIFILIVNVWFCTECGTHKNSKGYGRCVISTDICTKVF